MQPTKDDILAALAQRYNVAQFISFSPGPTPTLQHTLIRGYAPDNIFSDNRTAIRALLGAAAGSVNVRSFRANRDKGNPFQYGIRTIDEVTAVVASLAAAGYSTIVNETIDTGDGGVSGVALGGIMEFTPLDTPRGVRSPG